MKSLIIFISILIILICHNAFGQAQEKAISGSVTDSNGAVIQNLAVTLVQVNGNEKTTVLTDKNGEFSFNAVSPEKYFIRVEAKGFNKLVTEVFELSNQPKIINLKLEVSGINASVTVSNTSTAMKTDTPILETPFGVQAVPRSVLEDQQAIRIDQGLENVSGVYLRNGQGVENAFNIRGFETGDIYRDGVKARAGLNLQGGRETANLETIEVIKGPASTLFGRIEPGGLVNVTTKEPLPIRYYSLQQQLGSFSTYRTTFDGTGAITKDEKFLYRLNFAYENAKSFREFVKNDRFFISPVIMWNITSKTQLKFDLEYLNSNDPLDYGNPAVGNRPPAIPRERNLGESGSILDSQDTRFNFLVRQAFNDDWKINFKFDRDYLKLDSPPQVSIAGIDSANCTTASCEVFRNLVATSGDGESYFTSGDLNGRVATGVIKHSILFGADYWEDHNFNIFKFNFFFPSIDLYKPQHTTVDPTLLNNADFEARGTVVDKWNGVYLQDQISLPYNIQFVAGFRFDRVKRNRQDTSIFGGSESTDIQELKQSRVTPRFGVLWMPARQFSLYGNYVENFGASNGRNADGNILPPQIAKQWETGLKTELLNGRLTGSFAWFNITKQNIAVPDPNPVQAAAGYKVTVGEARNRGLEVDIAGEITNGLRLIAAYSYIDSEITKDSRFSGGTYNSGNTGNRFFAVPKHGGSIWAIYQPQKSELQGFRFGAGFVARSERQGDNANSFQLPAYAVVNLMAGYEWKLEKARLNFQFNADNLFDKEYFTTAGSRDSGIGYGIPRSLKGTVRVQF